MKLETYRMVKRNGLYQVKYNGKYVINYAWREPENAEKWVLNEKCINTISGDILIKLLQSGKELEIKEVKF